MSREWQARRAAATAAAWVARFDAGKVTDEERDAHQHWLEQSPLHREEYEAAQKIFAQAALLKGSVMLEAQAIPASKREGRPRRVAVAWFAAAAAVLCAVVIWSSVFVVRPQPQIFSTAVGERREITLGDGSVITLNTDSRLRVPDWDDVRTVDLERGEAFFAVAHDASRPFTVHAGAGTLRVLGTEFNIRLDDPRGTLAVMEGRVELSVAAPDAAAAQRQVLAAGEGAIYGSDGTLLRMQQARLDRITAWRTGKFIFNAATLAEVVREVNRYSHARVLIADPRLEGLRVNGIFPTDRIPELLQQLEKVIPVEVVPRGDTLVLVAR